MQKDNKTKLINKIRNKFAYYDIDINIDDMVFIPDDEDKKRFQGLTDDQIIEQLDEESLNRLADNITQRIRSKIKEASAKQKQDLMNTDYYEQFTNNPTEENLAAFYKTVEINCKNDFQVKELDNLSYSDEDLKIVLNGAKLAHNLDKCLLKINEYLKHILENSISAKTIKFKEDLKKFEEDIAAYEKEYLDAQMHCKNIEEFEKRIQEYNQKYKENNNGVTLEMFEQNLFKDKKDLENDYNLLATAHKKVLEFGKKALKEKQLFEDFMDKNNKTINDYLTGFKPILNYKIVNKQVELYETSKKAFEGKQKEFQELCNKQLIAKRKLKDVNKKIEEYVKISHKQDDASRNQ